MNKHIGTPFELITEAFHRSIQDFSHHEGEQDRAVLHLAINEKVLFVKEGQE